jgi:hypothetical protein
MIEGDELVLPAEAGAETTGFLRAGGAGEEAMIEALTRSSAELCESFLGRVTLARGFTETLRPTAGSGTPLPPAAYAIDIGADGDGWVRILDDSGAGRVRVSYEAGMASQWSEVPSALRHGIVRLAAHLYNLREPAGHRPSRVEPPASVTALWRPYRRIRLSEGGGPCSRH